MPRRTRPADDEAAAPLRTETDEPTEQLSLDNISDAEGTNQSAEPLAATDKAPRRRTRRPKAVAPVAGITEQTADSAEPLAETVPIVASTRSRRGGRIAPAPIVIAEAIEGVLDGLTPVPQSGTPADLAIPVRGLTDAPSGNSRRRRRPGGRRNGAPEVEATVAESAELVEGEVEIATEAAEESGEPQGASPRRRIGGRRGANARPVQPVVIAAADAADEEGDDPSETEDEGEGTGVEGGTPESRRSRRSRRGGRRRGKGVEAVGEEAAEGSVPVVVREERPKHDEIDLTLPIYTPPPIWNAPRLVPTPAELNIDPVETRLEAFIDFENSKLVVDGQPVEPQILFVNTETAIDEQVVREQIQLAAKSGIHLFSAVTYLPLKNAFGERSYTRTNEVVQQILDADPEARILLRIQCAPTNFWARTHPGELARYADGSDGDVSFASAEFWRHSVGAIGALIQHLSSVGTPGGDRVIGFHLDKGEWFHDAQAGYDYSAPNRRAFQQWLREKYQNIYAFRAAWVDGSVDFDSAEIPPWVVGAGHEKLKEPAIYQGVKDRRYVDYHSYASDIVADAITGLASAIKELTDGKLVVGASYGYTFEFAHRNESGHQSLYKVLASSAIDLLAGPNSYSNRSAGGAGSFCSPVDSVRLHKKIWLVEDDTKTHLAADETEDAYNPKVTTPLDTQSVHRRNALSATVHHAGVNWMDLWGQGWLNNDTIWSDLEGFRAQHEAAERMRQLRGESAPEAAVIIDEASFAYVRGDVAGLALQAGLISKIRDLICRSGASVGFYLQSDIPIIPTQTKVFIFLNALRVTSEERQAIRERLQVAGKTLVWLYGPGMFDEKGVSQQEVTEIVGQSIKAQPWNAKIGTIFTEERHPVIERLHGGKRMGSEDVLNPSFTSTDPQGAVLGEYAQTGAASIVARNMPGGWKSVFIGEPHLTGELVRGIFRYAGVHVYDVQDDIVAAADGLLVIHAPYTGQRTLHLPRQAAVYSMTERRLVTAQTTSFRFFMRGRSTHFFLYGTLEQIAEALGQSTDDLRQSQQEHHDRIERERSQQGNRRQGRQEEQNDEGDQGDERNAPSEQVNIARTEISGLEEIALPDNIDDLPSEEEVLGDALSADPAVAGAATPSRRRRWNRRQRSQRDGNNGGAPVSMDQILGDLPRRPAPPSEG